MDKLEQTVRISTRSTHGSEPAAPKICTFGQRTTIDGIRGQPMKSMHVGQPRQHDLKTAIPLLRVERDKRLPQSIHIRMRQSRKQFVRRFRAVADCPVMELESHAYAALGSRVGDAVRVIADPPEILFI